MPTDEEFEALQQQLTEAREKNDALAAERMYGGQNTTVGGGEGGPSGGGRARSVSGDDAFLRDFEGRWNSKNGRHSAMQPVSKAEVDRYVQLLAGASVVQAMAETSAHFRRAGISPDVVAKSRARR
jgi:hypothetical protein